MHKFYKISIISLVFASLFSISYAEDDTFTINIVGPQDEEVQTPVVQTPRQTTRRATSPQVNRNLTTAPVVRERTQTATQTAVENQTATNQARVNNTPLGTHTVINGETIWSIASAVLPVDAPVDEFQAVAAIYRANQNAFNEGDPNSLRVRSVLTIPSIADMQKENSITGQRLLRERNFKLPELEQAATLEPIADDVIVVNNADNQSSNFEINPNDPSFPPIYVARETSLREREIAENKNSYVGYFDNNKNAALDAPVNTQTTDNDTKNNEATSAISENNINDQNKDLETKNIADTNNDGSNKVDLEKSLTPESVDLEAVKLLIDKSQQTFNQRQQEISKEISEALLRSEALAKSAAKSIAKDEVVNLMTRYEGIISNLQQSNTELKANIAKLNKQIDQIRALNLDANDQLSMFEQQLMDLTDSKSNKTAQGPILWVLLGVGILSLVFAIAIVLYRRKVRQSTKDLEQDDFGFEDFDDQNDMELIKSTVVLNNSEELQDSSEGEDKSEVDISEDDSKGSDNKDIKEDANDADTKTDKNDGANNNKGTPLAGDELIVPNKELEDLVSDNSEVIDESTIDNADVKTNDNKQEDELTKESEDLKDVSLNNTFNNDSEEEEPGSFFMQQNDNSNSSATLDKLMNSKEVTSSSKNDDEVSLDVSDLREHQNDLKRKEHIQKKHEQLLNSITDEDLEKSARDKQDTKELLKMSDQLLVDHKKNEPSHVDDEDFYFETASGDLQVGNDAAGFHNVTEKAWDKLDKKFRTDANIEQEDSDDEKQLREKVGVFHDKTMENDVSDLKNAIADIEDHEISLDDDANEALDKTTEAPLTGEPLDDHNHIYDFKNDVESSEATHLSSQIDKNINNMSDDEKSLLETFAKAKDSMPREINHDFDDLPKAKYKDLPFSLNNADTKDSDNLVSNMLQDSDGEEHIDRKALKAEAENMKNTKENGYLSDEDILNMMSRDSATEHADPMIHDDNKKDLNPSNVNKDHDPILDSVSNEKIVEDTSSFKDSHNNIREEPTLDLEDIKDHDDELASRFDLESDADVVTLNHNTHEPSFNRQNIIDDSNVRHDDSTKTHLSDQEYQAYSDEINLATLYFETGDTDEALDILKKVAHVDDPLLQEKAISLAQKYGYQIS